MRTRGLFEGAKSGGMVLRDCGNGGRQTLCVLVHSAFKEDCSLIVPRQKLREIWLPV